MAAAWASSAAGPATARPDKPSSCVPRTSRARFCAPNIVRTLGCEAPRGTNAWARSSSCAARWSAGSSRAHAASAEAQVRTSATTRPPYSSPSWSRAAAASPPACPASTKSVCGDSTCCASPSRCARSQLRYGTPPRSAHPGRTLAKMDGPSMGNVRPCVGPKA
eukprot:scaffold23233_cov30-Tisochrysis_lutea.AAC.3